MWTKPSSQGEAKQGSIHWAGHKTPDPETPPGKGLGQHEHRVEETLHTAELWHPEDLCEGMKENSSAHGPGMKRKRQPLGKKGRAGHSPKNWNTWSLTQDGCKAKCRKHYIVIRISGLYQVVPTPPRRKTQTHPQKSHDTAVSRQPSMGQPLSPGLLVYSPHIHFPPQLRQDIRPLYD